MAARLALANSWPCARRSAARPRCVARLRRALSDLDTPTQGAKLALRSLARRIEQLDGEIAELDDQLKASSRAPHRARLLAISTGHAGQLLVTRRPEHQRPHGEGAFAALCGPSPIPASSARTTRHRLNYGADRDANHALHMIAVCRLRYCARTRPTPPAAPKNARPSEIIRCLKRYIAREAYHALQADLADLGELRPPRPRHAVAITCGAGFIGRSRGHLSP